jgi:DNA-binding transcriptional ArsR family regulator
LRKRREPIRLNPNTEGFNVSPARSREELAQPLDSELLQDAASMFAMLATPVRVHILWLLAHGGQDVGTLAENTGQSLATVSHHLGKLKLAGLVRDQRDGKRRIYVTADPDVVDLVLGVITRKLADQKRSARRRRA